MTELQIKELINVFETDINIYKWMKHHYSDVCSRGDVIINNILDKFNNKSMTCYLTEEQKYASHIYDTYLELYLKNKDSNPWWAD